MKIKTMVTSTKNDPVAYIDEDGYLVFQNEDGCRLGSAAAIGEDGKAYEDTWNLAQAKRLFYPGDEITIVF